MTDGEWNGSRRTTAVPKSHTIVRDVPRIRRALAAAVAVVVGLILAFATLEFGFARFYYTNDAELRQDEFDTELGWRLKAGEYTVKAPQAFMTHAVSINQIGLRETHVTLRNASPPARRVVMLGDSFTFGQSVDDDTLF